MYLILAVSLIMEHCLLYAEAPTDRAFDGFFYSKNEKELSFYPKPNKNQAPTFKSKLTYRGIPKAKENGIDLHAIFLTSDIIAMPYYKEDNGFILIDGNFWLLKETVNLVPLKKFIKYKVFKFKNSKFLYSNTDKSPLKKSTFEKIKNTTQFTGGDVKFINGNYWISIHKYVSPGCKEDVGGLAAPSCQEKPSEEIWMPLFDERGHRLFFFKNHNEWYDMTIKE